MSQCTPNDMRHVYCLLGSGRPLGRPLGRSPRSVGVDTDCRLPSSVVVSVGEAAVVVAAFCGGATGRGGGGRLGRSGRDMRRGAGSEEVAAVEGPVFECVKVAAGRGADTTGAELAL